LLQHGSSPVAVSPLSALCALAHAAGVGRRLYPLQPPAPTSSAPDPSAWQPQRAECEAFLTFLFWAAGLLLPILLVVKTEPPHSLRRWEAAYASRLRAGGAGGAGGSAGSNHSSVRGSTGSSSSRGQPRDSPVAQERLEAAAAAAPAAPAAAAATVPAAYTAPARAAAVAEAAVRALCGRSWLAEQGPLPAYLGRHQQRQKLLDLPWWERCLAGTLVVALVWVLAVVTTGR